MTRYARRPVSLRDLVGPSPPIVLNTETVGLLVIVGISVALVLAGLAFFATYLFWS